MPFTPYRSEFDADTLRVLHETFEMACLAIMDLPEVHMDEQMARDLIVMRIVAAARDKGERDTEQLKRYALQAFEA